LRVDAIRHVLEVTHRNTPFSTTPVLHDYFHELPDIPRSRGSQGSQAGQETGADPSFSTQRSWPVLTAESNDHEGNGPNSSKEHERRIA
jgi:hypothetical protein